MVLKGLHFNRRSSVSQSTGSWKLSAMTITEIHVNGRSMLRQTVDCVYAIDKRFDTVFTFAGERERKLCIHKTHTHAKGVMRHGWMVMSHCRWASNALKFSCSIKQNSKRFAQENLIDDWIGSRTFFWFLLLVSTNDAFHPYCHQIDFRRRVFLFAKRYRFLWHYFHKQNDECKTMKREKREEKTLKPYNILSYCDS